LSFLLRQQTTSCSAKSRVHDQARTQAGCRGCIPHTRPKEVLTWHLMSLKIIVNNIFVLHIT